MKDNDWVLVGMLVCLVLLVWICFQRIGELSNRMGMVITVQQSQQDSINRALERDADLLFKLGRLESDIEQRAKPEGK